MAIFFLKKSISCSHFVFINSGVLHFAPKKLPCVKWRRRDFRRITFLPSYTRGFKKKSFKLRRIRKRQREKRHLVPQTYLNFFFLSTYFNTGRRGCERLEVLRVQQVAAVRRQHLYDPDRKPFSLARRIRGRKTRSGCGNGRSLRSCPVWIVGGAAFRGLAA